jgi:signal transduction histidine kinase
LLCITTLAALVYGFFTYRLRQALKIERMRVKISSDLHDDVGTILSGLAMQSEILELSATEAMKPRLKRIGELSRSAMSHLRDTVWAIDARKDKLENLLDRMREHAEENLTPKGIVFDLETEQFDLQKNMPANIRQNLYLIYKEAITNIAKHSDANRVRIKLQKWGQNGLEMQIADNGNAVEKAYKTTGSGTSNMQMRAEKIGGTLEIIRTNGFCVRLRVKRV